MEFSIIVPVYNGEDTIRQCLEAICNQQGYKLNKDYEVIVIDDGSTDRTYETASKFKIKIYQNSKNLGRIKTRLKGAQMAIASKLIFVDSRNLVTSSLLKSVAELHHTPAIPADLNMRKTKYESVFHTAFFLIRRRYYGKQYFTHKIKDSFIKKENFTFSPKGTTLLVIDKHLFIDITPANGDKNTNDDTLLFHTIVFDKNIKILRSANIKITYLQRVEFSLLVPWLFGRGVRFADYYIWKTKEYLWVLLLSFVFIIASIILFLFYWKIILSVIVFGFFAVCIYLSENIKDFMRLLVALPIIVIIFYAGILNYSFNKFTKF